MKKYLLLFMALFVLGCNIKNDYELLTSQNGRVYRIDKSTGEVSLIEGFTITKLHEPASGEESKQTEIKLYRATNWPTIKLPGKNITLELKTIWREGNIHYQLGASPYEGDIQNAREAYLGGNKGFTVQMLDKDGFVLLQIPVSLSQMSSLVDSNGKRTSMEANDRAQCTSETYLSIVQWNATWSF